MIYTMGCSATKWYWPTWSDWLRLYSGQYITNWASKGYGNQLIYNLLLARKDQLKKDDHVIIMWSENDRMSQWYDKEWINQYDCLGFFPDTKGELWFTKNTPYTGLYRTHPEHQVSLSHMIVTNFQIILHTQMLLDRIGCKYTMIFVENPWLDVRPNYSPTFTTMWDKKAGPVTEDTKRAKELMELAPLRSTLDLIDWSKFVDPVNIKNVDTFNGLWEYSIGSKELVLLNHETDAHPNALAQHDFLVEKVLKQDVKLSKHRTLAKTVAENAITMEIPQFSNRDFIGNPDAELLDSKFKIYEK